MRTDAWNKAIHNQVADKTGMPKLEKRSPVHTVWDEKTQYVYITTVCGPVAENVYLRMRAKHGDSVKHDIASQ